jgi:hypothetical protein
LFVYEAMFRATKMMSQGITYSQVVEGPAAPPIKYRPTSYHAPSGLLSLRTWRLPYSRIPSSGWDSFHSRPQKRYQNLATATSREARKTRKRNSPCNEEEKPSCEVKTAKSANNILHGDPPCDTSNGEGNVKGVVDTANTNSVEEGNVNATSSEAKSAKLAK